MLETKGGHSKASTGWPWESLTSWLCSWWPPNLCFQMIRQVSPPFYLNDRYLHTNCLNLCFLKSSKRKQNSHFSLFSGMKWLASRKWLLRQLQCSLNMKYSNLIIRTEEQTKLSKHEFSHTVWCPRDSHWRDIVFFQALTVEIQNFWTQASMPESGSYLWTSNILFTSLVRSFLLQKDIILAAGHTANTIFSA